MTELPGTGLEILDSMRMGVAQRHPIRIRSFTILVRPLSILETQDVAQEVAEALEALPEKARNRISEHVQFAKKALVLATTSDVGAKDPKITEYVLDRFTPDEIDYLWKQYVGVTDKVNPALESLPQEEVLQLIDRVKKSPSDLIELSFLQLHSLARFFLTNDA